MTHPAQSFGPLAGIKVVDLTAMVFGPYATQTMADLGADVIKVEAPAGDPMRYISPGPAPDLSGVFCNINRGKKSVVMDLRDPAHAEALRGLIAEADVFIHSMRGKAIARLGFDYAAVRAIRPDIVYTNCYGYSRRGPDADKPAYDDTIQAECGIPHVQRLMTGEPGFAATIMADKIAGLHALYATLAALFHRERTGEGQEVEIGMFEAVASFMLVEHANGMIFEPPLGPAHYHRAVSPNRKPYATRDGHIAALIYNDKHWHTFIEAVAPDWASADYATLASRAQHVDTIYGLLGETFLTRTTDEWMALLEDLQIPCARVKTTDELFTDPHLNAVGFFEEIDSPHGTMRFPGVPTWFSATPGRVAGPSPQLGADSDEVLGSD
ncbi:CoA transferase [Erythrobacter arachoides]|uniref:CoA transferase n=1 Tax=Aurantiacibacter arachoides TaxID=1850444 RepID=A0A845A1P1_9SPHN|nr:CoA transferase [Aurantiacibacter arachoides]MXO93838.1 CoA transferase [Aurantiacibacter arachoides]GGD46323.1 CoA transferase [Aurantiacibacter arachoides]